jgi:hypothetical protein
MISVCVLMTNLTPAGAQPPPPEEPKSIARGEASPTIAYSLALLAVMLILLLVCMPARRE